MTIPKDTPRTVFAITSPGNDVYTAMTRLAVATIRLSSPALRVAVICDRQSDDALRQGLDPLLDEVDEWFVVDTPPGEPIFRHRYVKTSLRSSIGGPFLLLDSDILVRGDLIEVFRIETDIAGARNHSRVDFSEQVWSRDKATLLAMDWDIGSDVYINPGVLFCNDTPLAHRFWEEWHCRWRLSCAVANFLDQPAFNSALYEVQPAFSLLPNRFNAQFKYSPEAAKGAVVWHYYYSLGEVPSTPFEIIVNDLVNGGKLESELVADLLESTHPWRSENIIDDWAAARVMQRKQFSGWAAVWLRREMRTAIFHGLRRRFGALKRIS